MKFNERAQIHILKRSITYNFCSSTRQSGGDGDEARVVTVMAVNHQLMVSQFTVVLLAVWW